MFPHIQLGGECPRLKGGGGYPRLKGGPRPYGQSMPLSIPRMNLRCMRPPTQPELLGFGHAETVLVLERIHELLMLMRHLATSPLMPYPRVILPYPLSSCRRQDLMPLVDSEILPGGRMTGSAAE